MCDQCPYSGKAGIGRFGREALLGSEHGHGCAAAAAEQRPDHLGALCANTATKVCGSKPCGEGNLEASPYSAMSVSLDRTVVARLFSTRALTSSGNGSSHRRISPLSGAVPV
jgi:hypothetical protein